MRLRQKGRHKKHIIKSINHGDTGFYPVYCGFFCTSDICTRKLSEATCKSCLRAYSNQEGTQL